MAGQQDDPLDPDRVIAEVARVLKLYGLDYVWTDQLAADFVQSIAQRYDLSVCLETITAPRKVEQFESLRMRLADNGLEIPDDPLFRADLLSIRKRVTMNGIAIELPRTADGRHADYAPALALAAAKAYGDPPLPAPALGAAEAMHAYWKAEEERLERSAFGESEGNPWDVDPWERALAERGLA